MQRLTAENIVTAIGQLRRNRAYQYVNPATRGLIHIVDITFPEGPVLVKRYNPSKGETLTTAREESISVQMIWRIANAFFPNQPINFDRVLGGSYNTRSVLEALLVHTPQFYTCYPGRIAATSSLRPTIERGHKHVMWCPEDPHPPEIRGLRSTDITISEIPSGDAYYDALGLPNDLEPSIDIDLKRRHSQIQVALVEIGKQLGFRTWVAQNDRGITYRNRPLGEMESVVPKLEDERLIATWDGAFKAAQYIDCIWFKNGTLMPAVLEVEHTTGVTSGLTRMRGLFDLLPAFPTRYVVVAPDEERQKVVDEANRPQFLPLHARYFPYSAVEELYGLCQRRKIRGVQEEFLDCFMEPTTPPIPAS